MYFNKSSSYISEITTRDNLNNTFIIYPIHLSLKKKKKKKKKKSNSVTSGRNFAVSLEEFRKSAIIVISN